MKKRDPWTIKSSKTIYKNKWMELTEDSVIRPDGKDGKYNTLHILPGVSVLPVTKNKEVYLINNFHYALNRYTITAAGGAIDKRETPKQAAARELKEEMGLIAKKWTSIGSADSLISSIVSAPNKMFLAENLSKIKSNLDGTEVISLMKLPLNKAVSLVHSGEIRHPATALTILKAEKLLSM